MPRTPLPPAVSGAKPVLGHAVEFVRDVDGLVARGHAEHGKIFSVTLPGKPAIYLLGPEHGKFLFAETDKRLTLRTAYPFFRHMFAPDNYFLAEYDEYLRQREIILPRFQARQLDGYVRLIQAEADRMIDGLGDHGEFNLTDTFDRLVLRSISDCFLGPGTGDRLPGGLHKTFQAFAEAQDPFLPGWAPVPHMRRGRKARDQLRALVLGMLEERRRRPADPPDFLQALVEAKYSDGAEVPDRIRMNLVLTLLHAGRETTAGHISWAIVDLLRHPDELDKVRAEIDEVAGPGEPLDTKLMHRLARMNRALLESERMHPITPGLVRRAVEEMEYAGYRIPKGSMVVSDPGRSHRLPDVYPEPDRYHPDRYLDDDKARHTLIGFGGGLHRCIGARFAYLEIQVLLTRIFQRLELELVDLDPRPDPGFKVKWPEQPCRVRYRKLTA
ncbi:MAG TPA: cytochrome P450 [Amycolatopsis sp.]|nr:cytochrome P450 [Amycolatopsis sp.]